MIQNIIVWIIGVVVLAIIIRKLLRRKCSSPCCNCGAKESCGKATH